MGETYLRLDADFGDREILAKVLSEARLANSLEETIRYMCDPTPDNLNKECDSNPESCYTAGEVNRAQIIESSLDRALNAPGRFVFEIKAVKPGATDSVYLGKNEELSRYKLVEHQELVSKEEINGKSFNVIRLMAGFIDVGGNVNGY